MEERYRRLRVVLLAGLAVRLVLAPITSWGVDTPYFTLSAVRMLQTASPYGGYTFFNPPLGPVLELPGFALLSLFGSPEGFVRWYPALGPVAVHTQSAIPYLPTPAALLALKLPLIASDLAVALLLFHAVHRSWGDRVATAASAAWFLNPLVIWSTAVHGEVDTLAALFVLAALLALEHRSAVLTGVFLGLGTFSKLYPVLLVPLAAAVLALDAARGSPMRARWVPLARLFAGLALSVVPFLPLLSGFAVVIAHQSGNVNFGGLTVLIVFNPNITSIARLWPAGTASALVAVLEATAVVGVALSVGALAVRFVRRASGRIELPDLALLSLGAVAGSLLAILTTQPENIVALLVPLALAAPVLGRYGARAYWTVSLTAWAQYLTLLTPLAFFYPLFVALGPGAVGWANRWVVAYALNQGPVPAGTFWIIFGVVGGGALAGTWVLAATKTARRFLLRGTSAARTDSDTAAVVVGRVMAPAAAPRRMRRLSPATVVVVLLLVAMTVETGVATVLLAPPPPPLRVSVEQVVAGSGSVATTVRLSTGVTPVTVHIGVIPGFAAARGPVWVFADPAYPDANGSYTATHEIAERVGLALGEAGSPDPISFVDGGALLTTLASNDIGTVVVLGGTVPDSVLSLSNATLANWITAGGTLVWAGGPLGGTAGHPSPSGFVWSSLGWNGQLALAHFPVSDPGAPGPLLSTDESAIGAALGIRYNATTTGANTTEVATHGGTDLGVDSAGGMSGSAPRSSLVYQPVGRGGVFFFGGSLWASKDPQLVVPAATLSLSDDLALLLATGYRPVAGPSAHDDIALAAFQSTTLTLTVTGQAVGSGLLAVVTAPDLPTFLAIWSESVRTAP